MTEGHETGVGPKLRANRLQGGIASESDDDVGGSQSLRRLGIARARPLARNGRRAELRPFVAQRAEERAHERIAAVFNEHVALGAQRVEGGNESDADGRIARYDDHAVDAPRVRRRSATAFRQTIERLD